MRNLNTVNLETFAEVIPLTGENAARCIKDEMEVCIEDTKKEKNTNHKGLSFAFKIDFNPVRVTYKQLLREVSSLGYLIEEIMLRINELSYVGYANISYKFKDTDKI